MKRNPAQFCAQRRVECHDNQWTQMLATKGKICRKLHENEGNWTEPGDEHLKFDYVDPPLSPLPFWEFVHYTSDTAANKQHSVRSTWWLI